MGYSKPYLKAVIVLVTLLLAVRVGKSFGQNEVALQINSLKGIAEFGFTTNLEYNAPLNNKDSLQLTEIRESGLQKLKEAGIGIIPDEEIKTSSDHPFLYLHINAMDAGRGLVPFSITLYFYQPVKLSLRRNVETSGITWESGNVGIVSYDNLQYIKDSALNLLQLFIDDYTRVN